jgi:hypothetical protein
MTVNADKLVQYKGRKILDLPELSEVNKAREYALMHRNEPGSAVILKESKAILIKQSEEALKAHPRSCLNTSIFSTLKEVVEKDQPIDVDELVDHYCAVYLK